MVRRAQRRLLNPGIYARVLFTILLITLAYQVRPSYSIQIGGATDGPLLDGFNTREQAAGGDATPFRWTTDYSTITLAGLGKQDFNVTLSLNGWRPEGQAAPHLRISARGATLFDGQPDPVLKDYSFVVPREDIPQGTLKLELEVNPFSPPGDVRVLGVGVQRLLVTPAGAGQFVEPVMDVLLPVAGASALLGLFLALAGLGPGTVGLFASAPGVIAGWLVSGDRLWLTTQGWSLQWAVVVFLGVILALLVWLLGSWLMKLGGASWKPLHGRLLWMLVLIGFSVRLLGQLNPQICIIDLNFHLHRFQTVESGQLLFTITSAEWGGHDTFYLPTPYLFMLPLNWVFQDPLFVIRLFTVLISTLGAVPVFYIACRALRDSRAGVLAAALYLTVPIAVLPFSWGITTNLFGEFFALCSLAIVVGAGKRLRPTRPAFWALLVTLALALLSHPGVVQLTGLAFAFIAALFIFGRKGNRDTAGAAWAFGALGLAATAAYLLYYRHFVGDMLVTLDQIRKERAARVPQPGEGIGVRVGGSVADRSLGLVVRFAQSRSDWFFGGLRGFWQEAQAYYSVWPVAGALIGFAGSVQHVSSNFEGDGNTGARLLKAVLGWSLAAGLFAVVGWVANLYVRYSLFLLPVVALGSGALLSRLWDRGRFGPLLVGLVVAFFAFSALALWQQRINYTALCPRQ